MRALTITDGHINQATTRTHLVMQLSWSVSLHAAAVPAIEVRRIVIIASFIRAREAENFSITVEEKERNDARE